MYGKESIVKILLEPEDVRTGIPDNKNQMLLTSALAQGHDGIVKAMLEWDNANSDTADRGGQAFLVPSAGNGDECAAEIQFPGNDSSTHTSDPNDLPAPPSVDHIRREVVLDSKDSISMSTDGDFSAELSGQPQPPSLVPQNPGTLLRILAPILAPLNQSSHLLLNGFLLFPLSFAFLPFSFTSFRHQIYSRSVNTYQVRDWCK